METKICTACGKEKPKTKEFWYRRKEGADGYRNVCKECVNNKNKVLKIIAKEGYKFCSECKRELPANSDYFNNNYKGHSKLKLSSKCKECLGSTFVKDRINPKEGYKICSKCKKEKKANDKNFYTENRSKDGFASECKECRKTDDRKRFKIKYYKNLELYREKAKKYRDTHKEQIKKYNEKYFKKPNSKKVKRINTTLYRTKKKNLVSKFTKNDWNKTLEYFNNCCAYCGNEKGTLEMEHFIPLSKGGEFTKNNIIPACRSCNSSKNNKNFKEWYPKQIFYSKEKEKKIYKFLNVKDGKQQLKLF